MSIERFRIDFHIYSSQSVKEVVCEIQKSFCLKQEYFKRLLKKHYIKNSFILDDCGKIYLNYDSQNDYVYLSFEGYFSDYEKHIKLAYDLYKNLYKAFPKISLKLDDFLNGSDIKLDYDKFRKEIINFYEKTGLYKN